MLQCTRLVPYLKDSKGPVLDIATGFRELFLILKRYFKRRLFIGIDIYRKRLIFLRKWLIINNLTKKASLILCDARRLPFQAEKIRCIISHFGINYIMYPQSFFSEAYRILPKKGKIMFTHTVVSSCEQILAIDRGCLEVVDVASIRSLLLKCGFRNILIEEFMPKMYTSNCPLNEDCRFLKNGRKDGKILFKAKSYTNILVVAEK